MASRTLQLIASVALFVAARADAQKATVYYDHRYDPGNPSKDERLRYREPGETGGDFDRGPIDRLVVGKGKHAACFAIVSANPLLYDYSAKATAVEVKTADEMKGLLEALQALASLAPGMAPPGAPAARRDEADGFREYVDSVVSMVQGFDSMTAVRIASDTARHVGNSARAMLAIHQRREAAAVRAETLFVRNKASREFQLVRPAHLNVLKELASLRSEALAASVGNDTTNAGRHPLRCVDVDKDRLSVALHITPKVEMPGGPKRPTGDSVPVAAFEVDPARDAKFDIAPALIINPFTYDARTYGVENGVVVEQKDWGRFRVRTGLHFLFRASARSNWWGTVGASKGDDTAPDLFFGIVNRFGASAVAPSLALGFGLAAMRVPVGIEGDGIAIGQALPANVEKLEDVVRREYRGGLGVFVTLTGLKLTGDNQ